MQHVICIGAAAIDIKATPFGPLLPGDTTFGATQWSLGGVARNMAASFALLGFHSTFLGVVGNDLLGEYLLRETHALGVDVKHVDRLDAGMTSSFVALLNNEGIFHVGIFDGSLLSHLSAEYLHANRDVLISADLLVTHSNIPENALVYIAELAASQHIPLYVNSTSASLAQRVRTILSLSPIIGANRLEAEALTGIHISTPQHALQAGRSLIASGASEALITLDREGVVYQSRAESFYLEALSAQVIETTGAGDALCSSFLAARLLGKHAEESMMYGLAAAALTIESSESVISDLSWETLEQRRRLMHILTGEVESKVNLRDA